MKRLALIALLALILTSGSATAQDPVMWRFQVVTDFVGTGTEADPNRPAIGDDYALSKWEDVTGTPSASITPASNTYVIQAEAAESVLDSIEADNDYLVLWSSRIDEAEIVQAQTYMVFSLAAKERQAKDKGGVPDANEFGQIRSYLARNGVSQAQIKAVIGTGANGRTRGEISGLLREWMKTLEKGTH